MQGARVPKYQVTLSFAGEQRDYVDAVARVLKNRGITFFYDGFETANLWSKQGAKVFHDAFAKDAAWMVMFISGDYVEKAWPIHERKAALSRMIEEKGQEYILPVRFDDTPVPSLPDDVLYVSAQDYTPAQLGAQLWKSWGLLLFTARPDRPSPRMTSLMGDVVFDYSNYNGRYTIGYGDCEFETKWSKASNTSIHIYNDSPSINGVALAPNITDIHHVREAATLDFTSRCQTPRLHQIVVLQNKKGFFAALKIQAIKDDSRDDPCNEVRLQYVIQPNGSDSFANTVLIDTQENEGRPSHMKNDETENISWPETSKKRPASS